MNHHALPGFGRYIVTVKLPRNPDHNPRDKKTGRCPVSPECTDSTGEHHSHLVETDRLFMALERFSHVTRVERVTTVIRQVPDADYQILSGLSGSELLLRSDLTRAALDAYSVVFEPSRKLQRDHEKAIKAAVAAAILRLSEEDGRRSCSGGSELVNGACCPSCASGPSDEARWLRVTALRMDPDIEKRGNEEGV